MLALDKGPAVRGERVALGDDPAVAAALMVAVYAHAGVRGEIVMRPLIGVALNLPPHADAAYTARAIDAENVTAGFLDFEGRACVAAPADVAHVAQAAHAVAKMTHLLYELHTPFVDSQEAACPIVPLTDSADAPYELAVEVLEQAAALVRALDAVPPADIPALRPLVVEGLAEVWRSLARLGDR
jgi:hypothetical protein